MEPIGYRCSSLRLSRAIEITKFTPLRYSPVAFARIGIFEAPAHCIAAIVDLFRDRVTTTFAAHEGYLGYQGFTDVRVGRYIGVSYWASLAALEASGAAARDAREAAAELGARTVGEPLITREEFDTRSVHGHT